MKTIFSFPWDHHPMPFPCFHFPQEESNFLFKTHHWHPQEAIEVGKITRKALISLVMHMTNSIKRLNLEQTTLCIFLKSIPNLISWANTKSQANTTLDISPIWVSWATTKSWANTTLDIFPRLTSNPKHMKCWVLFLESSFSQELALLPI